jgi:DNA-binding response OmpR family regulator
MLVEDDEAIGSLVKATLEIDGFDVDVVADGTKALPMLVAAPYAAVVVDLMLPGRDGYSIVRDIRETPQTESLPIVILTAKADDASTWRGWQAGCDYYLTKPFDPDQLTSVVRRLVTERTVADPARAHI